jgi:hypothetical protein
VFQQTNSVNQGINLIVKKYNSTLGTFVTQNCLVFNTTADATYTLDPSGGGQNIPAGTTIGRIDVYNDATGSIEIQERYATGPTIVT